MCIVKRGRVDRQCKDIKNFWKGSNLTMKRIVSLFLVFAMLLTLAPMNIMAATESVFSDVKSSDYYAEAAEALADLGVLTGYPDGTFGAENSITRSEMAAVVCRLIDKESDAKKASGDTDFDDVAADHWASGYINVASKKGIINGDGNGKFNPEDDVKYEEAIKMLVCALGYADDIKIDPDDWSAAYLKVADENGITKNLKGKKGKASTRGDVAVMSYNGISAGEEVEVEVAAPTASLKAGSYVGSQKVELKTTTKGAEIYYTTNGSEPTTKSKKYSKAVQISETCFLRAIAVKDGSTSELMKVGYTILHSSGVFSSDVEEYTVSFDLNYEGATGAPKSQKVTEGGKVVMPEDPSRDGFVFLGWADSSNESDYFDFYNTKVVKNIKIVALWFDLSETALDCDSDGLSDYMEIVVMGSLTDYTKADSDNNGIDDGDEDSDTDGYTNKREVEIGTNPSLSDTDNDGLSDYDEIEKYHTDALLSDTDSDGVSDGKEIELGTNPLVVETVFSVQEISDVEDSVTASVEMNLSGNQVETLSVKPVYDDTLFPADMPGYMGRAYDFNVSGNFDNATIKFEFDSSSLTVGSNPTIYYYNENSQSLEPLETTISGNVASTVVTHFSKYILIDRTIHEQSFMWIDTWETGNSYSGVEVILVIDDSGSMKNNDGSNQRLDVAKNLVDKLPKNSKVGVIKFASGTTTITSALTDDKDTVKNYLTTTYFKSYGGTRMYTAINDSLSMFETMDESIMKVIVVLTDGVTDDTSYHPGTVASANEKGVKVYTVGLGRSTDYFERYLRPLAEETGAAFYLASEADQLEAIYDNISQKIDIDTDSDNDKIPDYYEDNMVSFSGVKLALDKNKWDTDGDGKSDGEEIIIQRRYNEDHTKVIITAQIVSDPCKPDTTSKIVQRLKNDTSLGMSNEKKATAVAMAYELEKAGYPESFIAGMLGNILSEGNHGLFERSAYSNPAEKPKYLVYMDENYDYRNKYSGQNVEGKSLSGLYSLICELEAGGYEGKFGLGCIQWTGSRTKTLIETYMEVANGSDTISKADISKAEGLMMIKELEKSYSYVYNGWKNKNSNVNSSDAAYSAGYDVCYKYEVPANREVKAVQRGDKSRLVYNVIIGK